MKFRIISISLIIGFLAGFFSNFHGCCPEISTSDTTTQVTLTYDSTHHKIAAAASKPTIEEIRIPEGFVLGGTIIDSPGKGSPCIQTCDSGIAMPIARDFFTFRIYQDTISDSSLTAFVTDTIYKNKLIGRDFGYIWKKPVQIVTTTVINNTYSTKTKAYLGISASTTNQFNGITFGPDLLILPKKNGYRIAYQFGNPYPIQTTFYWNIYK